MVLEIFNNDRFIVNPKGNRGLGYLFFLWRHQDAIIWNHILSNISTRDLDNKRLILLVVGWTIVQFKWSIRPIKRMQLFITFKNVCALRKMNMRICSKNRKYCIFEARFFFLLNLSIDGPEIFTNDRFIVDPKCNKGVGYFFFLWRHQDNIFWNHIFSHISAIKGWFLLVVGWMIVVQFKWSTRPIKRMQCAHYARNCASKFCYGFNIE